MSTKEKENKKSPEMDEVTKVKFFGGGEYDGIRELDNNLPPWLKYVFYISIIFAVAYLTSLFVFKNENLFQAKEYENDMAVVQAEVAKVNKVVIDENSVQVKTDEASLADGKTTFDKICMVCHGKFGEGLVGPNFTDEYWIHGGSIHDMYKVVITGVISKGMISYKNQLSGEQIQNVLSYIISLEGTNPPNQKAPQGEKYIREKAAQPDTEPAVADTTSAK